MKRPYEELLVPENKDWVSKLRASLCWLSFEIILQLLPYVPFCLLFVSHPLWYITCCSQCSDKCCNANYNWRVRVDWLSPSSQCDFIHPENIICQQALFRLPVCIRGGKALTTLLWWLHNNLGILVRVSMTICKKKNREVVNSTYMYLLKKKKLMPLVTLMSNTFHVILALYVLIENVW